LEEEKRLHAARVDALYAAAIPSHYGAVAASGILLIVLWDVYPGGLLASWFGALVVAMLGRAALQWRYARTPAAARDPGRWEKYFTLATLAAGAVWAFIPAVLFAPDPLLQTTVIIVVGGVIIAGAALCAASEPAMYGLITLPLLSLIIQLLLQEDRIHRLLAVAVLLFGFVIERMCRQIRRSIVQAFHASLRNELLLERVEQTETRLRDAIESCPEGIAVWDDDDRLLVCNATYARLYGGGRSAAELLGTPFLGIAEQVWEMDRPADSPHTEAERAAWIERLAQRHREGSGVNREYQGRDGRWRLGSTMRMRAGGWVGLVSDITDLKRAQEALERREEMVRYLAYHDPLTGIANRRLLEDRLKQAVYQAQRRSTRVAVMLVDLDHFKQVNDSAGHVSGDAVLREVATRLARCVRKADTLARHGGDEFVIVMADVPSESDCEIVAEKVLGAFSAEFRVGDEAFVLGASIGIALFPADAGDGEALLRKADIAMYRAKQLGRNHYRFSGR
jgi:diguanylate cyclase (GGDEF)-like protein/PAS domain S-box-containing protein